MKKLLASLPFAILLSACAPTNNYQPQKSPTQINFEQKNAALRSSQEWGNKCSADLRNPDVNKKVAAAIKIVDSEILFEKNDSPNKIQLMASNAKLTEVQKRALLDFIQAQQECRRGMKNYMAGFPALAPTYENYYGDMDIMYANLISKKITIGQANQEKSKLRSKLETEYANGLATMNDQLRQQFNQEAQARQAEDMQRRAIAAQFLMNQQNINAAQQMNQQNQLNNQILNNKPVTTNCNKVGNQVNCTSY